LSDAVYPPGGAGGSWAIGASPVSLLVVDSNGQRVGSVFQNGQLVNEVNEVSGAFYSGYQSEPQIVFLPGSSLPKSITVFARGSGAYTLLAAAYQSGTGSFQSVNKQIQSGEAISYSVAVDFSSNNAVQLTEQTGRGATSGFAYAFVISAIAIVVGYIVFRVTRKGGGSHRDRLVHRGGRKGASGDVLVRRGRRRSL
jgi:hypothetical protein